MTFAATNMTRPFSGSLSRLAPSPTGALHLGNLRTFVVNHLLARQRGWRMIMRIEDLDGPRVKPQAAVAMLDELRWLGFQWQGRPVVQSEQIQTYRPALQTLIDAGQCYPCICSRRDVEQAASAPQQGDDTTAYPGTCDRRFTSAQQAAEAAGGRPPAWRVRVTDRPIVVDDKLHGPRSFNLTRLCGDYVIYRNNGLPAYQLAVVVDDAAAGVDAIVRGDDLLDSAARQIHLRQLLGLTPEPQYWHLPLILGPDGRRLAKRHGDTRLSHYRLAGCTPQRLLGLIGFWCGLLPKRQEAEMDDLLARFDLDRLPRHPIVFTTEDDNFLTAPAR